MADHISLEVVDVDGAVREAADQAGVNRGDFLRRGAVAGGSFVAGGVLFSGLTAPALAKISSRRSAANDIKILNYALTLEYLEANFYAQAVRNNAFASAQYRQFGTVVAQHEAIHVKTLKKALGRHAVKKPTFNYGDTVHNPQKFAATAQALEDTGVSAYAGQGPNLLQKPYVVAALSILPVEARHAAWVRYLNLGGVTEHQTSKLPAPKAFDVARTEAQVLKIVKGTHFIK